jgi:hypothetical protein
MGAVEKEISFDEFRSVVKDYFKYIFSKAILIGIAVVIFFAVGVAYASYQRPVYTAELTFASENESGGGMGAYAGIAAQFGLNIPSEGGIFEGENLIQLLQSRFLLEKTFFSLVNIGNKEELLINYYVAFKTEEGTLKIKNANFNQLNFKASELHNNRFKDSLVKIFCNDIIKSMVIEKPDPKLNIISAKVKSTNELFAKLFIETLTNNALLFYVDYKSKKSRQNVVILQKQTDSVRNLLSGSITAIAVSNDLNVNPLRQITRTNVQRRQVDMQASSAMYGELLKQLELSKLVLRRETPLIQIIDTPVLPLEKKKLGRLMGGLIFGLIGGFLVTIFFVAKKFFQN